ncbi:MAG: hypothetical protein ACI9W6_001027 [Motiliproteus sp.]|jgi:hypothetical protein
MSVKAMRWFAAKVITGHGAIILVTTIGDEREGNAMVRG